MRPMYVELMEDVKHDMERIGKAMEELSKLHKEHLNVHFDGGDEEEQQIEILTGKIKGMFKSCETKVKSITTPPVQGIERTVEEEQMRKNIQKSLAVQLTDQSQEFRKSQRAYLQKLKTQKDRRKQFSDAFGEEEDPEKAERIREIEQKIYDPAFSEEQIARMILQETMINERDKEIRDIAQSITELAEMFKDLNQLVIEQGTILDRIDYNLEQTSGHIKEAVKELDKASEYQRQARMKMCILLLIVACIAIGVAVFVKAV
jgi:syntaxin 16